MGVVPLLRSTMSATASLLVFLSLIHLMTATRTQAQSAANEAASWWASPMMAGSVQPAQAAPSTAQTANVDEWLLVAYAAYVNDNWEIFVDGPHLPGQPVSRQLTEDPGSDLFPRLNPQADQVVFASNRDGDYELFTVGVDGAGLMQLTDNGWNDTQPAWSPDGRRIAFVADPLGHADIFVMQADGAGVAQLTDSPADDLYPTWSPDGAQIAWVQIAGSERTLWVMNVNGSNPRPIGGPFALLQNPVWSPDGLLIAISLDLNGDGFSDIATIRPDGGDLQAVSYSPNREDLVVNSWLPSRLNDDYTNAPSAEVRQLLITTIQYAVHDGVQTPSYTRIEAQEICCRRVPTTLHAPGFHAFADAMSLDREPPRSRLRGLPAFSRATGVALQGEMVDFGGSGVAGVLLEYRHDNRPWYRWLHVRANDLPVIDNPPGRTLYLRTQAYDHAGNFEPWSAEGQAEAQTTAYRWRLSGAVTDNRGAPRARLPVSVAPAPLNTPQTDLAGHFVAYLREDDLYTLALGGLITREVAADEHYALYLPPADAIALDDIALGEPCVGLCLVEPDEAEETWQAAAQMIYAIDADGVFHVTWKELSGASRIYYQRRTPAGNWGLPELVALAEIIPAPHSLAVGADGVVHIAWNDVGGLHTGLSENRAYYARRSTTGRWSTPQLVGKGDTPQIAVGADGLVHLFFQCKELPCGGELHYLQRGVDGRWSEPVTVDTLFRDHQRAIHVRPNGAVLLAWTKVRGAGQVIVTRKRSASGQWGAVQSGLAQAGTPQNRLHFEPSGRLHVLWPQTNSIPRPPMRDYFFTTYWAQWDEPGGWSEPVALDQEAGEAIHVSVDAGGVLHFINDARHMNRQGDAYRFATSEGKWSSLGPVGSSSPGQSMYAYQRDAHGRGHAIVRIHNHLAYLPERVALTNEWWTATHTTTVPATMHEPTLTFLYQLEGGGAAGRSVLQINVQTPTISNTVTATVVFSASGPTVRQLGWADLTPWVGQPITLTFALYQAEDEPLLRAQLGAITIGSWTTPVLHEVTPERVEAGVATTVLITGENLLDTPGVRLGAIPLSNVRRLDENTLEADLPADIPPGAHYLWVVNPDGSASVYAHAIVVGEQVHLPLVTR
ncbi:MAG: PD40 domain-containing protein [Caldilineaceae bacterium]|nr:PD40 domain-containing protein [Caldilineaceae bacterium]